MSFRKRQKIFPRSDGKWVDGHWMAGAEQAPFFISASVQPATRNDYDRMVNALDGKRVVKMVRLYTDARLTVAGADLTGGDILEWRGNKYVICQAAPWQSGVIPHHRYLAIKDAS